MTCLGLCSKIYTVADRMHEDLAMHSKYKGTYPDIARLLLLIANEYWILTTC